jgi:hypothetical protein
MLSIAEALLAGNMMKPLDALALQLFYMLFHKNNQNKFVATGKKLTPEMLKSITKFI